MSAPPPWSAELEVDPERAERLLARAFPSLAPLSLQPLGSGWDNTAYLVGGEWVFRFPRRAVAVPLMEAECAVLPGLAKHVPLPIPDPVHQSGPASDFPWPFAGYRLLPGRPASEVGLDAPARTRAAPVLGRFLRALHAISTERALEFGAHTEVPSRLNVERTFALIEQAFSRARGVGSLTDLTPWEPILADVPTDYAPDRSTLVHGDLDGRHVLVDEQHAPCGVIDWGDVHLGDAAVDLALPCGFLPPSALEAFAGAYGPITDTLLRLGRLRALQKALIVLVYAHDTGLAGFAREARAALEHLRGHERA